RPLAITCVAIPLSSYRVFACLSSCFIAPPTTGLHPLSLHDALPILEYPAGIGDLGRLDAWRRVPPARPRFRAPQRAPSSWCSSRDRKSTRLNSSHVSISYAVFCLKKKKQNE